MARIRTSVLLGVSLVLGVLAPITLQVATAPPADAVQATGGNARFKAIEWFSWGADQAQIPNAGITRTETYTVAGQSLSITCTLSNIARTSGSGTGNYLESYRSGTWQGDGFDELYNIGGTDSANTMVVGLSNRTGGNTITLDFSCSATLGGASLPLAGLVMADAEASGGSEYVGATIPTSATWRILDRVRGASCTLDAYMRRTVNGTANRLEMYGPASNTCENGGSTVRPGPSAVAFMEGATSATNVTIQGGGKSAIALGVALNFDFGDAPLSYGQAGAGLQFGYTGGEIPVTPNNQTLAQNRGTPVFQSITLAENTQPPLRLGNTVDPEISPRYSADALGDDTDGNPASGGPDDEDALSLSGSTVVVPGSTTTFSGIRCLASSSGSGGYVAGWIDWNLNGAFDAGEISTSVVACPAGGGTVSLTFAVPSGLLPNGGTLPTYLRLRLANTQAEANNAVGVTTGGEVEDHAVTFTTGPRLTLAKQVGTRVAPADQFTVTMAGAGLGGGVSATTSGTGSSATTGPQYVQTGQSYTLTDAMAAGSANPLSDYTRSIACVDRANGNAPVATSGSGPTWTLSGVSNGQYVVCTITNSARVANLSVVKTPGTATGPAANGSYTVTYRVTVANSGALPGTYGPLTDTPGFPPNLAVDGITWTGSGGAPSGSATGSGPFTLAPAGTSIPRDTTHTYDVTIRFHYTNRTNARPCTGATGNGLFNRAALPDGQESAGTDDNAACVAPPAAPNPVLSLDKQASAVQDLDGNGVDAGDRIDYTFLVTNTGNVTVNTLAITDPMFGSVSCVATTLTPGASTSCSASHTITQTDMDSGAVNNTATAGGRDPNGDAVTSPSDSTSTQLARASRITLDKQASAVADTNSSGRVDAGDRITYTFVVTNSGNTTVSNLAVADNLVGPVTCPVTSLTPGASTTCTAAPYTLTLADLDRGSRSNSATATGRGSDGTNVSSTDQTTTTLPAQRSLALDKQAGTPVDVNGSGITDAGDTIAYTFLVTNTSNVTLNQIAITDSLVTGVTCPATSLAPGASTTCTASPYVVTEADEQSGSVVNTARARGTDPGGTVVQSPVDTTSTPVVTPNPRLEIDKQAGTPLDVNGSGITDAGDRIPYTFTVTNRGNVPVRSVSVNDPKLSGSPITCSPATLSPGATATCGPVTYTVTVADQTAGSVDNSATARGTDPDGGAVTSPPDTTSTPVVTPNPALTLVKTASPPVDVNGSGITDAGDTIRYSFTVRNSGNVPVAGVAVTDAKLASQSLTITCTPTALAVGQSATCSVSAPYTVTAADVTAGSVDNTATARGRNPDGGTVTSNPSSTSTPTTPPAPGLTIDKRAAAPVDVNGSGITDAGDTIAYTFTVTNSGNVPITSVAVTDPKLAAQSLTLSCTPRALQPGQQATCTASGPYTVTTADETAGAAINTARATGTNPDGGTVTSPPDSTQTPVTTPQPLLALEKTAGTPVDVNGSGITDAGDTISYSFRVTNSGNVPISSVAVSDPMLAGQGITITCAPGRLVPGASATCTTSRPYTVTEADERSGTVTNSATASGRNPDGGAVTSPPDGTTTPTTVPAAALAVEKTAGTPVDVNGSGITDAGDTIRYTFAVSNTGNVPVRGIAIDDPTLAGLTITCDATTLAPGASTTCRSGPYTVTKADEAAGVVANTATATGTDPDGGDVTSPPDTATVPVTTPQPSLTVRKSARTPVDVNGSGLTDAGDTIVYEFAVTNTGNVPLRAIAIADPKLGPGTITCPAGPLAPGASVTCVSAPYVVTAGDVASGSVRNTATASGTDPDGDTVRSDPDTVAVPTTTPQPALGIEKTAGTPVDVNGSGLTDAGDTITYTFRVTNTGNVPVTAVTVVDPKLTGQPGLTIGCPGGSLAPGASVTCTASDPYVVTAADVAAGSVHNSAHARGTDPDGDTVTSADASTSTPTTLPQPGLRLVKTAGTPVDVNGSGLTDAGDTIRFGFTVTNTGNVPIAGVAVDDPLLAGQGITISCAPPRLGPGDVATCTSSAPYVVTDADVAAGAVANRATAHGTDPDGHGTTSPPDTTSTPTTLPEPTLTVDKSAGTPVDVNGSGLTDAGDRITFSFTVTNTGNVPITGVGVNDPMLAAAGIVVTCTPTRLDPGEVATCTSSGPYTVTNADVASGAVANQATATGRDPDGDQVTSPPDSTSTPTTLPQPSLTTHKIADPVVDLDGNGPDPGDTIRFHFVVTNSGNVPLSVIQIVDPMLSPDPIPCGTILVLAPSQSGECATQLYTVTDTDFDAGAVNNSAVGTAQNPDGGTVTSPPTDTSTPLTQDPALHIVKHVDRVVDSNGSGITDRGDRIWYSFTVSNPGNVTIHDITVVDQLLTDNGIAIRCGPNAPPAPSQTTLAAGASMTCVAVDPLIISANQVELGHVVNVATAAGTRPDGQGLVSAPSTVSTPTTQPQPQLEVHKAAGTPVDVNASGLVDAGDTVAFTFTVTNTGNVPITDVAIDDPLLAAVGIGIVCDPTTLPIAPNNTATCSADRPYVITTSDVAAGAVANSATAIGRDPDGNRVTSPPATTTTPTTTPQPRLQIVKSVDRVTDVNGSGLTDAGDTIGYSFRVTNTGNVPIAAVAVVDDMLRDAGITVTCPPGRLAVGASVTCTVSAPYTVTEDDEQAGAVANSATATGTDPDGHDVVSAPSTTSTPTTIPRPDLQLVKTAGTPVDVNGSGITDAGDTIAFTFEVTNTGNVPVTQIAVDDPMLEAAGVTVDCGSGALAPGDVRTCTVSGPYVVTEADEDAGSVANSATATGTDPDGDAVTSAPATTSTPTTRPEPGLAVDKTVEGVTDVNASGLTDAGDEISYGFTVTNTGNVPITAIEIVDGLLARQASPAITIDCPAGPLAPGDTVTCDVSDPYVVTTADVAAGSVANSAVAQGNDPDGDPVVSPPDTTSTPTTTPRPAVTVDKTAGAPVDVNGSGITDAGDTIAYTFTVTNTGNVPLTSVTIDDPMLDAAGMTVTCPSGTLAVGATVSCAASDVYTVTEADERAGSVDNAATSSATDPDGGEVTSPPDTTSTPVTTPQPALQLVKTVESVVDVNGSGLTDAPDEITYSFEVTNTGNVPVADVAVDDPLLDGQGITISCTPTTLAPDAVATCTPDAPYVVSVDDELSGTVRNVATASATDPDGDPVTSPEAATTTPTTQPQPALTIDKSASVSDENSSGLTDAGDLITYTFEVTNTGNVPITDLAIEDAMLDTAGLTISCADTDLAVDASTTCTSAPYTVTQDDETAGTVTNSARATGDDPNGAVVTSPYDDTTTPIGTPRPALTLDKQAGQPTDANGSGAIDAGDTITYTFVVTNSGNVPLTGIEVTDDLLPGPVTCDPTALAPGDSVTCAADPYVLTQADLDAGSVRNTATATGTDPNGSAVPPATDSLTTRLPQGPALDLVKRARLLDRDGDGAADAGERIRYTFRVTNTGTVTVSHIRVRDTMLDRAGVAISCPRDELAPGAAMTCSATYTVTGADVQRGEIVNVATVRGSAAGDPVVSNDDRAVIATDECPTCQPNQGGSLPDTGGPSLTLLLLGLGAIVAGGLLLMIARRRPARAERAR